MSFITVYNVVFTSLPILAAGIFEQDVSDKVSVQIPQLYEAGPRNEFFSLPKFAYSLFLGTWHSAIIYFVAYLAVGLHFGDVRGCM